MDDDAPEDHSTAKPSSFVESVKSHPSTLLVGNVLHLSRRATWLRLNVKCTSDSSAAAASASGLLYRTKRWTGFVPTPKG